MKQAPIVCKNETPSNQSPSYRPLGPTGEITSEACSCRMKTYDSIELPSSVDQVGSTRPAVAVNRGVATGTALPTAELEYIVPAPPLHSTADYTDSTVHDSSRFDTLRSSPGEDLIYTTLHRAVESVSFGFSLSNGIDEPGVFVGAVKEDGPATEKLKAYDRIIQVRWFLLS